MPTNNTIHTPILGLCVLLGAACGGTEKKVDDPQDSQPDHQPISLGDHSQASGGHRAMAPDMGEDDDGMEISGLKGTLSSSDIERAVTPHSTTLARCFETPAKKKRYLGGAIELSFTVARNGSVKRVQVSKSTLGSHEVERCLLTVSQSMKFTKPKGGEADFSLPLDFEATRIANWWSEEKSEAEVAEKKKALKSCAGSGTSDPRNVWVTLYLGNRGVVSSAGFASPHEEGIDSKWSECAVAKIQAWTLSDPRGKIAKLGFRYNPE